MEKINLFKDLPEYKASAKQPKLVNCSQAAYFAIDGQGAPGGEAFADAIGALYAASYTVKMARKGGADPDYVVNKLEIAYPMTAEEFSEPKANWRWRLQIRVPLFVTENELNQAKRSIAAKGNTAKIGDVFYLTEAAHQRVIFMHIGPYETEGDSYARIKTFAEENKLKLDEHNKDICVSDPRRIAPEKLKTIVTIKVS